ncbi:hypothetical protein HUT06_37060 [Actinomadura sp. NAK00032]|uniref:hypothetical protein n=1 Tax=Actinomadura sp. NAK00032 TaxID=2742128 RepID=UPI0015926777|nr:hypothetical protein [Actinomadura sp. NAK00032]QKW38951.1 hypothetical protein HUT06_37060 [Actinomadura sp. NAK00032]
MSEHTGNWRVDGPQPLGAFVGEGVNDQLMQISVQLAAELWATRRRLAALESQLVAGGAVVSPDAIDADGGIGDRADRDAFIQRVFGGLAT